jgi:hypothetical protein
MASRCSKAERQKREKNLIRRTNEESSSKEESRKENFQEEVIDLTI